MSVLLGVIVLYSNHDAENENDLNYLNEIKSGNQMSFDYITEKYMPLIESMTNKYYATAEESGYEADEEDFRQEAVLALYNAALSYKNEKNDKITFGLYAKICIRNSLISMLRKLKHGSRKNASYDFDSELQIEKEMNANVYPDSMKNGSEFEFGPEERLIERESYEMLLERINRLLTDYEREVLELYMVGKSYHEIGILLSKTEKSVDNAIYRIKRKLKNSI